MRCAATWRSCSLFSFFVFPFSLFAQSLPVFRASTDVVAVPVTVTDRAGRFVSGLTADQFELTDAGERRRDHAVQPRSACR